MKTKKWLFKAASFTTFFTLAGILLINGSSFAMTHWDKVEAGFQNPPATAKPRVWWHWMNGNVSKEGIKADLTWMDSIGIGGFQNFDAGMSSPQVVDKRLVYMTPEWKDAFKFTAELADSLGMEMAIAGSPGWSESGGPWVTEEQAMKKYVWSETKVAGGGTFSGVLPMPPTTIGEFQNISGSSNIIGDFEADNSDTEAFYADAAVVAFKVPENDRTITELNPSVTSSGGQFALQALTDGDVSTATVLPAASKGEKAWIQFAFSNPQTIRSYTLATSGGGLRGGPFASAGPTNQFIEASDDGQTFRVVAEVPSGGSRQNTYAISPVTAKYFRFCVLNTGQQAPSRLPPGFGPKQSSDTQVTELMLHTGARIHRFEDKAGFSATIGVNSMETPPVSGADVVSKENVIDLTSKMAADGSLTWKAPEGDWVILRLGYSLIGTTNHPASPEATGLEVDKLDPNHVRAYLENYLDQYKDATGGLMGERGLQYIITDSWEAGTANWTDNMITEFGRRNGYDMMSWLPVLTGHVVESAEASDKFLWDFRNTLEDLVAEYHYDLITEILKERGMGRYSESHEQSRALIADGMEVKRAADVPMSATWVPGGFGGDASEGVSTAYKADMRESASVAHIYGQNLVAAESMTAGSDPWGYYPEKLKPTADTEMANGLNRFVIHTSVHQPVDDKIPGLTLGMFGQWFTRHETWAQMAKPWISYLGRSSYLLQQGKFVADVVYMYGEGNNITGLFSQQLPEVPRGYEYDFVNADAVLNVLSVESGRIATPSGMRYRLLALDKSTRYMSLPVLKKIREMVKAGAVAVGPKPKKTPSLNDDDAEFKSIADELWTDGSGVHAVGEGTVYAGMSVAEALDALGIEPDFTYTKPKADTEVLYVHRALDDADIYWVNNRSSRYETIEATFRVDGKVAEIWNPESGEMTEASYSIAGGKTTVPLSLKPDDAIFVVFRQNAASSSYTLPEAIETTLATLEGPWELAFQAGRGAPGNITLESLTPWNENKNFGVKYFSGIGTYTKTLTVPAQWLESGREIWIDLGSVQNLAEVSLNGQTLGTVWKTPFRVNLTKALTAGDNKLEIKVANLWVNRIIGDLQPDAPETITFTAQHTYQADSPLLPSGLLGPVQVVGISEKIKN